ncbi:MAG: hypothetical protein AB8B89_04310 [Gammaproteobacteria bacterium]
MSVWIILIVPSVIFGVITAFLLKKSWAIYVAGVIPWLGVLCAILYTEYFMPYEGGGASMWPIAQFFGGGVAAIVGIAGYLITGSIIKK